MLGPEPPSEQRVPEEPGERPELLVAGSLRRIGNLTARERRVVLVDGDRNVPPFKYFDKGSMATIGYRAAVADAFGIRFTGSIGYLMWGFIHVLYLIGWGNRVAAVFSWARALTFSKNRPHRTITYEHAQNELAEHHYQRE